MINIWRPNRKYVVPIDIAILISNGNQTQSYERLEKSIGFHKSNKFSIDFLFWMKKNTEISFFTEIIIDTKSMLRIHYVFINSVFRKTERLFFCTALFRVYPNFAEIRRIFCAITVEPKKANTFFTIFH